MKYLVTGACGLVGSNLAAEVLAQGHELIAFDNLSRNGTEKNREWLFKQGSFQWFHGDIRNAGDIENVVANTRPDVIFHLAGQVAMTTSLNNPRLDFETNALGTLNVLESVRKHTPKTAILYSSTNKVYGDLNQYEYREGKTRYYCDAEPQGFNESVPLDFSSPYGCSKGSADQYMLDFNSSYGLNTVVFRHSSIFGARQFATFDQGWVGWFVRQALETVRDPKLEFTISGNGKQVRDVLYASDLTSCYFKAAATINKTAGECYNIGGGQNNSLSLLELFAKLEQILKIKMNYRELPWRQSDQKIFVADNSKATQDFDWSPKTNVDNALKEMVDWSKAQFQI